jgi:hypothetical protein
MDAAKSKSPERDSRGFRGLAENDARIFPQHTTRVNTDRFRDLLERHVSKLVIRGRKAAGLCPFHPDRSPSFSADLDKGVWYCFPCHRGGGVKDFALAVGESWATERHSIRERTRFAATARRRQAEQNARAILERKKDERDTTLWAAWGEASTEATHAADLLGLFFRRPDLAEEFPVLVDKTESEYSDALFQKMLIEAQAAGEVA